MAASTRRPSARPRRPARTSSWPARPSLARPTPLPRCASSPRRQRGVSRTHSGVRSGQTCLQMPTSVLIVDDHPSFRATARLLLEAEGWLVVGEAEDVTRALERAAELKPDVVLLDINLPDIDGFAVSTRLTAQADPPAVVLCSSRDGSDFGSLV